MKNLGLLTTEFGLGVAVLIAGYELADSVVSSAQNVSVGAGIAIAGTMLAIAWMSGKYAQARTDAKKVSQ